MSGDIDNPRIWVDADVYVADVGATAPDDLVTSWPEGWEALGLISEDTPVEGRSQDTTDHYAHGGILFRTTRSKHKRTLKVTALEDNPVVWGLVNPGSTADSAAGMTTRTVKVPVPDPRAFGLELVDGSVTMRRIIPKGEVVDVGDVTMGDSDPVMFELTINIYPDADGVLYVDLTDDPQAEAGS